MKKFSKILSVALLVALVLSFGASAFAASDDNGSITITNATVDETYKLYKLFDATVGTDGSIAYSTTKDVSADTYFNTYFEIKNGNIFKKDAFTADVLKTDAFKTWAEGFGSKVAETKATSSTVTFDDIDFGYYFVSSSLGSVISVDSANPNASIIDKNQKVTFDKNIVLEPATENAAAVLGKVNEAGLNIEVPFDIKVEAKNYEGTEKVFKYVIYDTLDNGFSLNNNIVVKVAGNTITNYTIVFKDKNGAVIENATLPNAAVQGFEITIPWTDDGTKAGEHLYDANDVINVTYSAYLDPAKAADVKFGANPNLNTADVKYFKGEDTDTPSGDLPDKQTETFDTQVKIIKIEGKNNGPLTGAEFTLTCTNGTKVVYVTESKYVADEAGTFYQLTDGTYTSEAPNGTATHDAVYASTTQKYKLVTESTVKGEGQTDTSVSSFVGSDGTVTFTGLGVGTYTIEETVVPAGYNKADNITFTISFDKATKKFASDNDKVKLTGEATNVFDTTVVNNKGTELPSTGGIGTTIFYVVGGVLVLAAIILLVTKKRMSE